MGRSAKRNIKNTVTPNESEGRDSCPSSRRESHGTEIEEEPKKIKVFHTLVIIVQGLSFVFLLLKNYIYRTSVHSVYLDGVSKVEVKCSNAYMPELTSTTRIFRYSRICFPNDGKKYPLHVFAHGNFAGGAFGYVYRDMLNDIASRGFVASMYMSCALDLFCDDGNGSFLEILNSVSFLEDTTGWWDNVIDFDAGYSASGHSTGGRAVLTLAALKDNPTKYLANTKYASMITSQHRKSIQNFDAIVADYPDPVFHSSCNPDIENFYIEKTPVMIVTGSEDYNMPELSAWNVFETIASPDKVYVNMLGVGHLSPIEQHQEGPYIAHFSRCFVRGGIHAENSSAACEAIYGDTGATTMRKAVSIAGVGHRNSGDGRVGFLGCRGGNHDNVPAKHKSLCSGLVQFLRKLNK